MQARSSLDKRTLSFPRKALVEYRELIAQLVWRDVIGRYKGSLLGVGWSFLNPLLMLVVYSFVFSVVFQARWGMKSDEGPLSFGMILFVGLMVHGLVAECLTKSPLSILNNPSYVKKVIFPLEILPLVTTLSALFHLGVSFSVLLAGLLLLQMPIFPTVLLFPAVILPLAIGALGLSWLLAALGVFLRDVSQTTTIASSVLLFISPVFYPASAVPEGVRSIIALNPLSLIIEQARRVVFLGTAPDWFALSLYLACAVCFAAGSLWLFQRMRPGFADVI